MERTVNTKKGSLLWKLIKGRVPEATSGSAHLSTLVKALSMIRI